MHSRLFLIASLFWLFLASTKADGASSSPSLPAIAGVQFLNEQKGFLLQEGPRNCILRTQDGGETWVARPGPAGPALMRFTSEARGWILTGSAPDKLQLYFTDTAGQHWKRTGILGSNAIPIDFVFVNESTGIFIINDVRSHSSRLVRTTDGGRTFSNVNFGVTPPYTLNKLAFDGHQLWVVGQGLALESENGGETWEEKLPHGEVAPAPNLQRAVFNKDNVLFVGETGVFSFKPSSNEWSRLATLADKLHGIWAASHLAKEVCIVGSSANLFCSSDGKAWSIKSQLPLAPRNRVAALQVGNVFTELVSNSNSKGWLIDESGRLFQSTDGGATWQQRKIPYGCQRSGR